jgi:hypothetical protein
MSTVTLNVSWEFVLNTEGYLAVKYHENSLRRKSAHFRMGSVIL